MIPNFFHLSSGALALIMTLGLVTSSVKAENTGEWELIWQDEFDGSSLDENKWNFEEDCWGGGNNERQCYTKSKRNVSVSDGTLKITALKKVTKGFAWPKAWRQGEGTIRGKKRFEKVQRPFSSGRITTKNKGDWLYGRFEARMRLPLGQGTWPAFWMLPSKNTYGTWPLSGEIDIMEAINLGMTCASCAGGREDRVHGTIHFGNPWPKNNMVSHETHLASDVPGFHDYAMEWYPNEMRWYVDGKLFSTVKKEEWFSKGAEDGNVYAPFDQPFHLIINLAVGGKWPEENNNVGFFSMDYPKSVEVDFVRVYQCPVALSGRQCVTP